MYSTLIKFLLKVWKIIKDEIQECCVIVVLLSLLSFIVFLFLALIESIVKFNIIGRGIVISFSIFILSSIIGILTSSGE